jgi:hypothetical protein
MSSSQVDCRAAWPASPVEATRASNARTNSCAPSRSPSDPNVPTPSTASVVSRSVQVAGMSDLLPSGRTSSNSTRPCRRICPNNTNSCPSNGCRGRLICTVLTVSRRSPGSHQHAAPRQRPDRHWLYPKWTNNCSDRWGVPRRCSLRSAARGLRYPNTADVPRPPPSPQAASRSPRAHRRRPDSGPDARTGTRNRRGTATADARSAAQQPPAHSRAHSRAPAAPPRGPRCG